MLTRNAFASVGMVAFLASMVLGVAGARAQEGGNWQAERARHIQTIDGRVKKGADQIVSREKVAKAMGFPWPVKDPTKRKDQIVGKIQADVDKEAQAKFPQEKRKEFLKEAKELYRVYQPGELVEEFRLNRPGTATVVRKGYLRQVTVQRIRVGSRWLIPADLSDEVKARFYDEFSEKMIDKYTRRKNSEYDRKIDGFKQKQMERRLPLSFMNAGYCPRKPSLMKSTDANSWWSRKDAVEAQYKLVRDQVEDGLRKKIEREVFQANGYVRVAELKNAWMPKAEADAYREKVRKEKAEKEANNMDMFGEGGGGAGAPGGEEGMMMEGGMNNSGGGKKAKDEELFD